MALKFGTTTVSTLKFGTSNVTTGKFGSTTVFTSGPTQSWHTVYSGSFYPDDNQTDQQVCSIPSGTTNVRVTLTWWLLDFATDEDYYDSDDVRTFSSSDNVINGGSGLGTSSYYFHVSNGKLFVDSSVDVGEDGLYYIEITKVEAYY